MTSLKNVPDFFLVGAPKCATSSLHLLLLRHPDIFMCTPKEPHFFSTDLPGLDEMPNAAAYDALFADAPENTKLGEASAFYLSSKVAAENIHAANPAARIIISIRNPVDAVFSWYHQLRDGLREDQTSFETAWNLQEARLAGLNLPSYCPEPAQLQYRSIYSYHDQISRYFDRFGRDAVKVLRVEQIAQQPEQVATELFKFIRVDPEQGQGEVPQTNTRRQARFPLLTQFVTSPPGILRPLVAPTKAALNRIGIQPSVVMMKYLSRPAVKSGSKLDGALRQQVQETFAKDIERLEMLLDTDLSGWR